MRFLIVTHILDKQDQTQGFFHRWVAAFAAQSQSVHVIALKVGEYDLPDNVTVHSLGMDEGVGRLVCLKRFLTLVWRLRFEYEQVFVYERQVYAIAGYVPWLCLRKVVGLWHDRGSVSRTHKLAVLLVRHVFTSTSKGLKIDTTKKQIVGQGIATDVFATSEKTKSDTLRLITVGGISPVKNIDTLIEACVILKLKKKSFVFTIVGQAETEAEKVYQAKLTEMIDTYNLKDQIVWRGAVPNHQLPEVLQKADVFIHDGATSGLDKTLIEAGLCGCVVLSSNPAYRGVTEKIAPDLLFNPKDSQQLADMLMKPIVTDFAHADAVREKFASEFSLPDFVSRIIQVY